MTHILHVITGLEVGGAERMLEKIISHSDKKFQHTVLSLLGGGAIGAQLKDQGVTVHFMEMRPARPSMFALLRIAKIMRRSKPDLIHGWMYHGNIAALLGAWVARSQAPVIWSVHGLLFERDTEKRSTKVVVKLGAYLSSRVKRIIYKSQASQDQHEQIGYSAARSAQLANGFDTQLYRPISDSRARVRVDLGVSDKEVLCGLVSRLHPVKDHANFVSACLLIAGEEAKARFLMVGRDVETAREQPAPLGPLSKRLGDRLITLPEQRDVSAIMNALDIHVVSSASESFPNVLGEAMACGVPSVTTDVGECRTIVGDTGLVVPPKSSERLASAMLSLIQNGALRKSMGEAARRRVEECYSMERVMKDYEQIWSAAIEAPDRSAPGGWQ